MNLSSVAIDKQNIEILLSPKDYYQRLITLITQATQRIYITALYLQNDEAGTAVLDALYRAKEKNPQLDVCIFVDAHRAQRGLIGEAEQLGNRAMYMKFAQKYAANIEIYGIAVKTKELLGVLHLKGMVFDDELLYSGASINNIYLHHQDKYRLDRYYQISSTKLANSFCQYLTNNFIQSGVAIDLTAEQALTKRQQRIQSKQTTRIVKHALYSVDSTDVNRAMQITPLVGCGKRKNVLNNAICQLLKQSSQNIVVFTPYFNLPRIVTKQLVMALKRNVKVTIIVGDKTASDFYISDEEKFSTIGIIPYIYEQILQRFVKRWQSYIDSKQLTVKLWKDGENSYHLKGMVVDERYHLLTGSNLNPRAWGLDLENGLLIDDPKQSMMPAFEQELATISENTSTIEHFKQLDTIKDYPLKPRKLLRRLKLSQIDKILKGFL